MSVAVLIPLFEHAAPSGLPKAWEQPFADTTVLGQTLRRLAQVASLETIALLHEGSAPAIPNDPALQRRVKCRSVSFAGDIDRPARLVARRWATESWRGGLGGATCYDELLAARPMLEALEALDCDYGLLVGPDWPLVDPFVLESLLARHAERPDLKMVFTQVPPGLGGFLIHREILEGLAQYGTTIGSLLEYRPTKAQSDPIGMDLCAAIPSALRDVMVRAVFDAPRWQRVLRRVESSAMDLRGEALASALSVASVEAWRSPRFVGLELTPWRTANGLITPQHHLAFDRDFLDVDRATDWLTSWAGEPDVVLGIGGIGEPLLHERWSDIVSAARQQGLWGVHLQTDLRVEPDPVAALLEAPLDLISVRLNADREETYHTLMVVEGLPEVWNRIERMIKGRGSAVPWIVPRLMKTAQNVDELGDFFDRWTHWCGQAVIEGPSTGCGLMPDLSVIDMSPPSRGVCRQLGRRMTVLSDGCAALCDQDWQGQGLDREAAHSQASAWSATQAVAAQHAKGHPEAHPLCARCREWHRP